MLQMNVSQLLKSLIGATRDYTISETVDIAGGGYPVQGDIRLLRTHRGILAKGILQTEVELTCSRCLTPFSQAVSLTMEDEYIPEVDVTSGATLPVTDDPGIFTINERHILDLTEAVRQYTLLGTPMKPLCRENCAGLCPSCGHNLNQGTCNCPTPESDQHWSELSKLSKN